jgi:hypothetical protein
MFWEHEKRTSSSDIHHRLRARMYSTVLSGAYHLSWSVRRAGASVRKKNGEDAFFTLVVIS